MMHFKVIGNIIERVATFGMGLAFIMGGIGTGLLLILSAFSDEV